MLTKHIRLLEIVSNMESPNGVFRALLYDYAMRVMQLAMEEID